MQKEQQHQESVDSFLCPSFSTYSSDKLADIADQVTRDHQNDNNFHANDDNDFEFVAFRKAADGVFFEFDGYAAPVFPVFNRDLVTAESESDGQRGRRFGAEENAAAIEIPMDKLLIDYRGLRDPPSSSSSSSEADDLEAIPAGTYCVWTPNSVQASPNRCKKSNSTGSSSSSKAKRWKLLDLLRRSNSDGKERLVFLTPSSVSNSGKKKGAKAENSKEKRGSGSGNNESAVAGKKVAAPAVAGGGEKKGTVSAHEALYVRNREMRRVDKRKSYLPYRQDLVGFFANLNAKGRAFPLHV